MHRPEGGKLVSRSPNQESTKASCGSHRNHRRLGRQLEQVLVHTVEVRCASHRTPRLPLERDDGRHTASGGDRARMARTGG